MKKAQRKYLPAGAKVRKKNPLADTKKSISNSNRSIDSIFNVDFNQR